MSTANPVQSSQFWDEEDASAQSDRQRDDPRTSHSPSDSVEQMSWPHK
eukprot:CAMPEP_0171128348 /NCGR_PEP_ID=MMETSP0766_2-20121228/116941_1 /TAXON_ID=439317 /ORGANISM="Gambierdiscus australes, Strain CAWD 149" /LENGTH=47 /DNA_ID= /DNA_START= /DNA_END= /DNA_ORIENTATION=